MSISSVNGGAAIDDGQLDVEIQIGESITASSATVTIKGVVQANVMVDNVTDKVLFNHIRGDMTLNSKGETPHTLAVEFIDEIVEIQVGYGQSNTFGFKTVDLNPNDTISESTSDILMINGAKTALTAATQTLTSDVPVDAGDSDCMIDLANYFREYANGRGTTDLEQVVMISGQGASSVIQLAEGTVPFISFEDDFTLICGFIVAAGKVPHVSIIDFTQGENESNTSTTAGYAGRLATTLYDPMVVFIKSITGQTDDPVMQNYVSTMHSNSNTNNNLNLIAIEQLAVQALRPDKIITTVHTGWVEHVTDGVHFSGKGQRYMRQMQAKFAAYTDLRPLEVSHQNRVGSTIELLIKGGIGDLQFDFTMHSSTTNQGMRVFNSSAAAVTISLVAIDNVSRKIVVTIADGGTNGPYTIDGCYFSNNALGGGQFHPNVVPITDSDTRDGVLSDSVSIGNQTLTNPVMPFNLTVLEP